MSLQVWLPLNGNLNNQGLSDVTVTNNGATADSNGKIGSCYSFDGNDDFISLTSSSLYSTIKGGSSPFSIAMWIYRADTTRAVLFGDYNLTGSIDFNIELSTSNTVRFYWGANPDLVYNYAVVTTSKWNHLALTYDGSSIKCYINGVFAQSSAVALTSKEKTSGGYFLGRDSRTGITAFNGKMNDFRLYNHCLSAKEVKEISKGLVCHYKLDNNGFGNPNLITTMTPGGRTTLNGKYGLNADFSQNLDTYGYFNVSPALELNSAYTLSFDVSNFPRGGAWSFNLWNNANYSTGTITKDGHYTYTFVPSESKLPNGYSLTKFLFDDAIRTNPAGTVYFTNFKIEKGDRATSWCPHTSDSLYTSLGLGSTVEPDCSGLSNNGTKIGGLSPSTNPASIRYESCYDFDGNTGSIQIPNLSTLVPSGEFTMNCWIYHDNTWSSEGYETIFGGPSGFELDAKHSGTNSPRLYACDWGKGSATYELNKWNMITMTRNTSETKFYINGELKITGSAGSIPPGNYFIGAWKSSNEQNYKGKISDFRLYSTVLPADDIKILYNTSASIDKSGNMHAYEFKEE